MARFVFCFDRCRPTAPILVFLLAATPSPSSSHFPNYPVRAANDYAIKVEKGGITIGVQPLESTKDQKSYFNTELTSKGFIPVFVVIQNESGGDSYLFDKTKVAYGAGDSSASSPKVGSKKGEALLIASVNPVLISPIGVFVAAKMISGASQVQQNIIKNEIQSKTLSPGGSVHGFLYVPIPKKGARQKMRIEIPVTRAGTDETVVLDLLF
jgi:hypothetical protein